MRHEKVFDRSTHKVKITATLHIDQTGVYWNKMIERQEKDKRKWGPAKIFDVTAAEVLQTQMELWEKIKPA